MKWLFPLNDSVLRENEFREIAAYINATMEKNLFQTTLSFCLFLVLCTTARAQVLADTVINGEITPEVMDALVAREERLMREAKAPRNTFVKIETAKPVVDQYRRTSQAYIYWGFGVAERLLADRDNWIPEMVEQLRNPVDEHQTKSLLKLLGSPRLLVGWTKNADLVKAIKLYLENKDLKTIACQAWGRLAPDEAVNYLEEQRDTKQISHLDMLKTVVDGEIPMVMTKARMQFWLDAFKQKLIARESPEADLETFDEYWEYLVEFFSGPLKFEQAEDEKDFLEYFLMWYELYTQEDSRKTLAMIMIDKGGFGNYKFVKELEAKYFKNERYENLTLLLARLQPSPEARRKAYLEAIRRYKFYKMPQQILDEFYNYPEEFCFTLAEMYENKQYYGPGTPQQAIHRVGGMDALELAAGYIQDPEKQKAFREAAEFCYAPLTESHPLMVEINKVQQFGAVCGAVSPSKIDQIRKEEGGYSTYSLKWVVQQSLPNFVHFDSETGLFPNPYDELFLNTFVPAACGKLDGLRVGMSWDEENYDDPGTKVWMVFRDKAYVFEPQDDSDWYDLDAVQTAINTILETEGFEERFVLWDPGDQTVGYYFGEPAKTRVMLKQLGYDVP